MNDSSPISPEASSGSVAQPAMGAGQLLRQYRESTGLHIVALSSALKVARAKLEALEADRLDDLPDVVFARALAMSCCRYLGKDPEPVLALMPGHAAQPTPALRQHLPAQQQEDAQRPRFTPSKGPFGSSAIPQWAVWVLVLVVIVVGGWFAAAPQRPVVKPPAAPLDFPPQGVPGAEPVTVTSEPVATSAQPGAGQPAAIVTPGTSVPGNVTAVPAPLSPSAPAPAAPSLRLEPSAPARN
jgi:cytoskeleton protein RodZ